MGLFLDVDGSNLSGTLVPDSCPSVTSRGGYRANLEKNMESSNLTLRDQLPREAVSREDTVVSALVW